MWQHLNRSGVFFKNKDKNCNLLPPHSSSSLLDMSADHLAFDWRREKNTFIWSNHPKEAFCSPAPSCLCWIWSIAFRQGSELSEISTHGHSFMYADDERLQWYHFTTDVCVWWWFCYRDDCESISLYWAKSVKQFSSSVLTISYYLNIFYLFSSYVWST